VSWDFEFQADAERDLRRLDHAVQDEIIHYLRTRVMGGEPDRFGKPLRDKLRGLWRWRVGDYRIIGKIINRRLLVLVVTVGHRSKVYEG
jgi:mRNA interferase RelE/StbE